MSETHTPPPVPPEVAAAQEPWPDVEGESAEPEPATVDVVGDGSAEGGEPLTATLLARAAGDRLEVLARVVRNGVLVLGGMAVVLAVWLAPGVRSQRETLLAVVAFGLVVLGGLTVDAALRGFACLLHLQADQAEAAGRVEQHLASGLRQLAVTLDALAAAPHSPAAATPISDVKAERLAEARLAIRAGHWDAAEELVRSFAESHPDDPDASRLADDLSRARQTAGDELLAKVQAAREVNDPDRVIEVRAALKPLLAAEALRALDRDLAKWFMILIQRRLRTGTVRADVAVLAARVAESLDDTPEGASLRASLPTLRRAAGLCPRCGQPYTGLADACPACLAGLHHASPAPPAPEPSTNTPPSDSSTASPPPA
jgi:hypothetical protein